MPSSVAKQNKTKKPKQDEAMDEDALFESAMAGSLDFDGVFKDGETLHAPDALDFEDEDELAEDELPDEEEVTSGKSDKVESFGAEEDEEDGNDELMNELEQEGLAVDIEEDNFIAGGDMKLDSNFQEGSVGESDLDDLPESPQAQIRTLEEQKQEAKRQALEKKGREDRLLRKFYPDFKEGVVMKMIPTFSSLDYGDYSWYRPPLPANPLVPTKLKFEVASDERKIFCKQSSKMSAWKQQQQRSNNQNYSKTSQRVIPITDDDLNILVPASPPAKFDKPKIQDFDGDLVLATCDWDDEAIMGGSSTDAENEVSSTDNVPPSKRFKLDPFGVDDWIDDDDIFEGQINVQSLNLKLDANDPHILLYKNPEINEKTSKAVIPTSSAMLESRFDISNDKEYDMLRANYHSKVRSTVGNLSIEHSLPATRLQYPYYKIKLEPKQARMLHRPQFFVRPNSNWVFTKVKKRKTKKDKGKTVQEIFSKSVDLSLRDSASFFMMEYTEEYPLALSNFGMASKLINYYRKRNDEDTTRPRLLVGETHVLGVQDKSPFWSFGFVEPGNVVPTLYNRMVRAPVFKQEPKDTDFLLVRSTGGSSNLQKFYLRPVTNLFTVGQQFPSVEIPGPHSRKVTSTSKNRLKMIVYRCLNKNEHQRLAVRDISTHFPDQNDMQNRQRLKEFMEYQRVGDDHGYWKIKKGDILPNFEQIRNMITPEDISLLESMTTGDQYLNDIAYYYGDEEEQEKQRQRNREKSNYNNKNIGEESIEEQLAPWNITRNFLNAIQGKAMLQIRGEGDPTGRGEAFSFLRTSMKGGFKSSNEDDMTTPGTPSTPISSQVKVEKKRGRKKDEEKAKMAPSHKYNVALQQKLYEDEIAKVWYTQQRVLTDDGSHLNETSNRIQELDSSELADDVREGSKVHLKNPDPPSANKASRKFLKITRMVRDSNGILQRKIEIIKDSAVIKAYVERKIRLQVTSINTGIDGDAMGPTADPEQNERMKKALLEEIERLEKSKERRKKKGPHRRKKGSEEGDEAASPSAASTKKSTNRRCKRCGSTGHISTNKKLCPMYGKEGSPSGSADVATPNSEANFA